MLSKRGVTMRTYTNFLILLVGITTLPSMAGEPSSPGTHVQRPHVPGKIRLITRVRRTIDAQNNAFKTITQTTDWEVSKTAIIICDMGTTTIANRPHSASPTWYPE